MLEILISAKQGGGKTTLQRLLRAHLETNGWDVCYQKFADPLYEMHDAVQKIAAKYGVSTLPKDGDLLQLLGTEWGRNKKGPDVWVNALRHSWKQFVDDKAKTPDRSKKCALLVDDLRFENEFEAFPRAFRIRLEASEEVRRARASYWRENTRHPSEISLDAYAQSGKFDVTIDAEACSAEQTLAIVSGRLRSQGSAGYFRGYDTDSSLE